MEVGCPLWVKDDAKDSELAWVAGVLASKEGPELTGDGSTRLGVDIVDSLAAGRARRALVVRAAAADSADAAGGLETDELKLRNEEGKDDVADLITLPHLHEPAILRALEVRYARGEIYTFTGPILLAVNPFQKLPRLCARRARAAGRATRAGRGRRSETAPRARPPVLLLLLLLLSRQGTRTTCSSGSTRAGC